MFAEITKKGFKGVKDGEVYPTVHPVGSIVEGDLARVAIESGFAEKEAAEKEAAEKADAKKPSRNKADSPAKNKAK